MDHVEQYDLPPNPAKEKDSRFVWYEENYGDESWEVDALESEVFQSLLEHEIQSFTNMETLQAIKSMEVEHKLVLEKAKSTIEE